MMIATIPRIGIGRAVHLIDAENLCGSSLLMPDSVAELRDSYLARVPVGPLDHLIFASAHVSMFALGVGWPGNRILMRSGPDGADICLAKVIADENLEARFDHIYLGSGDGGLAPFAGYLGRHGGVVTAVSLIGSLSPQMRLAASDVIYLDRPGIQVLRATQAFPASKS